MEEKKKFRDSKYFSISLHAALVGCALILAYFAIKNISMVPEIINRIFSILSPFMIGGAIAYILNPLQKLYEKGLGKMLKKGKVTRMLSILFSVLTVAVFLMLLMWIVVPVIYESLKSIVIDSIKYVNSLGGEVSTFIADKKIAELMSQEQINEITSGITAVIGSVYKFLQDFAVRFLSATGSLAVTIFDSVVGIIIAVTILSGKETFSAQIKRMLNAFFKKDTVNGVLEFADVTHNVFSKYINAQIIDAIIVGLLCFVAMIVLKLPYALLVSTVIAITNVIPYFGPFIGAIPSALIILTTSLKDAVIFAVLILVIQQIDGNIINPRIVGSSTGIAGIWVIFAVTIGGAFFKIPGMFMGVPVFAIFKYYTDKWSKMRLASKGLPTDEKDYLLENLVKKNSDLPQKAKK